MPNALLEAMACALPCVATRVSGSEDIIEQGINGLLVEPERPEQLAYALRLLIEDTDLTRQLGWQGYETVLRYHQLGLTVQNCLTFYRYLLARDAAHRRPTVPLQAGDLSPEEWKRQ
jgi:glycosyltransferase involved in cell wall biosynthesis